MNARLTLALAALAVTAGAGSVRADLSVVDRSVHRALAAASTVDLIVRMKPATKVAEGFHEAAYGDRAAAIHALKTKLETTHAEALKPLAELFTKESTSHVGLDFKTFWIAPVAAIKGATIDHVMQIAALPNVESVAESTVYTIPEPLTQSVAQGNVTLPTSIEWNVAKIGAPQVWADGNVGQGVRVGGIDTGVRPTHVALKNNFGGAYSWFDPELKTAVPHDDNGHGTHTMGIVAGTTGVGVAPGVTWMACRGCRARQCVDEDLLACAQFMLCPTDTNGTNADCSKAPRVINNSWGGGQGDHWYSDAVNAWRKAGIIPVFSIGNEGPECGTASTPGDYATVIGVGGTDSGDALGYFSNKGPTVEGLLKPDITAPGDSVRSAYYKSDTGYIMLTGTSQAAPHVTGAIALLLEAEPSLTFDEVKSRLYGSTVQVGLPDSGYTCGNTTDAMWPNNQYGYGRLSAFDAYRGVRSPVVLTPAPASGSGSGN